MGVLFRIYIRAVSAFYKSQGKEIGKKNPQTGAVTFIQRFGGSLNLNIHFYTLFLDGVYFKNEVLGRGERRIRKTNTLFHSPKLLTYRPPIKKPKKAILGTTPFRNIRA